MALFRWLPKVNRCCFCTRSLKCASFMIIIIGMVGGINTIALLCTPACKQLFEVSSPVKQALNILRWVLFSSEMLLLASIFGFLLGIFYLIRITADILICIVILKCLISVAYAVIMTMQEQYTNCRWYYSQIFHLLFFVIIDDCCACLSLKLGSILIALCGLLGLGSLAGLVFYPICKDGTTGLFPELMKYFAYVSTGVSVLLMICSLLFLIGACLEKFEITATLFLIAVSLFLLVHLAGIILAVISIIFESDCRENLFYYMGIFILPLWIYFMIVVKSFQGEME